MTPRLHSDNLIEAERLVRGRMGDQPFDFEAMSCLSNVYRAATAFRNRVERDLLSREKVSWSGFTTLFVLWVWGPSDANQLAQDVGVSNPTLTGLISTLQRRELVEKLVPSQDRRKTIINLTGEGTALIERLFPEFHAYEVMATSEIPYEEQRGVSNALRHVIRWAEESDAGNS